MKHDLAILNELKPDGTLKLTTDKARKRNIFDVMKEKIMKKTKLDKTIKKEQLVLDKIASERMYQELLADRENLALHKLSESVMKS